MTILFLFSSKVLFYDPLPFLNAIDEFQFAYDHYAKFENSGGKDLLLGANRMTNRQLFWLALARSRYRKQKATAGIEGTDYDRTFFWFKNKLEPLETYDRFKEAFECNITLKERKSLFPPPE